MQPNKEKLKRFMADETMNQAVYAEVLSSFLKKRANSDINVLGASFLAIGLLQDAWKDLNQYTPSEQAERKTDANVGV